MKINIKEKTKNLNEKIKENFSKNKENFSKVKQNLGIKISFIEQEYPKGLPDAFILGESFIGKENVALILGDNFFYGQNLS